MFIVWSDNALLRCDTYYYRWNFVSKSVINEIEGVTGCLLMKRVIDITKTDPQVLTWAITRMADRVNDETDQKPVDLENGVSTSYSHMNTFSRKLPKDVVLKWLSAFYLAESRKDL